jgi:hypothetical protein
VAVSYCTPADIRDNVSGTDAGTGTCAALTDGQLYAAIDRASAKVSAWTGADYDLAAVPDLISDLTVQMATFYATLTYRKSRDLSAMDPVYLQYVDAMATLTAISKGQIQVVPTPPAEPPGTPPPAVAPRVINTVPRTFSGEDSNTEYSPDGRLRAAGAYGSGWGYGRPGGW